MENQVIIPEKNLTAEEAIKIANEIERIESAAKAMKDQLKKYVEVNGPLETSDKIWDFSTSVSYKFNGVQLREVAQNIVLEGKNPWDLMSIATPKLQTLGWSEDVLKQLGTQSSTTRFSSRKK